MESSILKVSIPCIDTEWNDNEILLYIYMYIFQRAIFE